MFGKFRPPLLKKIETPTFPSHENKDDLQPPPKKRRIGSIGQGESTSGSQLVFKEPGISSLPREPLLVIRNPAEARSLHGGIEGFYNVLW